MPLKLVLYSSMTDVVVASSESGIAFATLQVHSNLIDSRDKYKRIDLRCKYVGPVLFGLKNDILFLFIYLKLELLTQFPASIDKNIITPTFSTLS